MLRPCAWLHVAVLLGLIICAKSLAPDISKGIYKIRQSRIPRKCQLFIGVPTAAKVPSQPLADIVIYGNLIFHQCTLWLEVRLCPQIVLYSIPDGLSTLPSEAFETV